MACLGYNVINAMKIAQRYTQGQGVSVVIGTLQDRTVACVSVRSLSRGQLIVWRWNKVWEYWDLRSLCSMVSSMLEGWNVVP